MPKANPRALVSFSLTKDELMLLLYAIPRDQDGDPFKDLYELESQHKHKVRDVNRALKGLNTRTIATLRRALKSLPGNGNPDDE